MATQALANRGVFDAVEKARPNFIARLPKDMDTERMYLGLMTVIQKKPELQKCSPQSIVLAGYEAAELGINLSPSLQLGYIIGYGGEAQFQIGYRGMIQKAYETGLIKSFYAEVVYEKDKFEWQLAPHRTITHTPANGARGEKIGAYALIEFKDGHLDFEYLTKEQIEKHKKASKNQGGLLWTTFEEEGWRKTPIRVLSKRLPLTNPGMEKLAETIARDAERDADPIIPGRLEIEAGTAAPASHGANTETQAVPTASHPDGSVSYHTGDYLTEISGMKLRHQFSTEEMRPLGLKIDNEGHWTIPAANTHSFVEMCGKKNILVSEIDKDGEMHQVAFQASDEDLPEAFDLKP